MKLFASKKRSSIVPRSPGCTQQKKVGTYTSFIFDFFDFFDLHCWMSHSKKKQCKAVSVKTQCPKKTAVDVLLDRN